MQSDSHREAVAGRVCSASPRASSPAESRAIFCSSTQQTQLIFTDRLDMKNTFESRQCARSFQCLENNAKQREKILNSATIFVLEIHFFFFFYMNVRVGRSWSGRNCNRKRTISQGPCLGSGRTWPMPLAQSMGLC